MGRAERRCCRRAACRTRVPRFHVGLSSRVCLSRIGRSRDCRAPAGYSARCGFRQARSASRDGRRVSTRANRREDGRSSGGVRFACSIPIGFPRRSLRLAISSASCRSSRVRPGSRAHRPERARRAEGDRAGDPIERANGHGRAPRALHDRSGSRAVGTSGERCAREWRAGSRVSRRRESPRGKRRRCGNTRSDARGAGVAVRTTCPSCGDWRRPPGQHRRDQGSGWVSPLRAAPAAFFDSASGGLVHGRTSHSTAVSTSGRSSAAARRTSAPRSAGWMAERWWPAIDSRSDAPAAGQTARGTSIRPAVPGSGGARLRVLPGPQDDFFPGVGVHAARAHAVPGDPAVESHGIPVVGSGSFPASRIGK